MRLVPRAPSLRERRNLFEGYSFFFDLRNSPIDLATGHLAFRLVANTGAADTALNKILNHLRWKEQDVAMAQHCALRGAGRARCVDEQYQLLGRRGVDEFVPQLRMVGLVVAAERQQLVERQHLRVAICRETLKIEHDYLAELRAALA